MKTLIIFNNLNDIVYLNCCSKFVQHVERLAAAQGLVSSKHSRLLGKGTRAVDPNVIIQLFSPLVTSHRFMKEQFENPYNSVHCDDGTNIVFQDYMGFLFLKIGCDEISFLRRCLGVCIEFVAYICGPDVFMLKSSQYHSSLVDELLSTWAKLYLSDQSFLVEAVEQMVVNMQLSSILIKSLEQAAMKVRSYGTDHIHAILFVETKLLSWYSTRRSFPLSAEDLMFLITLCQKSWPSHHRTGTNHQRNTFTWAAKDLDTGILQTLTVPMSFEEELSSNDDLNDGSFCSSLSHFDSDAEANESRRINVGGPGSSNNPVISDFAVIKHYLILLKNGVSFVPHRVHIGLIQPGFYLVLVCESAISALTTQVATSIQLTNEFLESKREAGRDKHYFELLEASTKKVLEHLKKHKNAVVRSDLVGRWDRFKSGFQQYLKTKDPITLQMSPLADIFRDTFRSYFNHGEVMKGIPESVLKSIWKQIQVDTSDFWDFLKVKAVRNTTLGSRQHLSINKYLEEFPGLVHFIYIDRNHHWLTAPALDSNGKDDTIRLTKKKIWNMIKFAREHMQQGNFSLMWKDSAFNYAYFLWFEDPMGQAIRPKVESALPWENFPIPGILCSDFYKHLLEQSFPNLASHSKVRCLELFCIHLGLVTSSCVLEHSKRLATTICEITGTNNGADFL